MVLQPYDFVDLLAYFYALHLLFLGFFSLLATTAWVKYMDFESPRIISLVVRRLLVRLLVKCRVLSA